MPLREERQFRFRFDPRFRTPLALLGVRPDNTSVTVDRDAVVVRFGPWRLRTARGNVVSAQRTGPYRWWRAIGPRLSLADGGATFGTTVAGGVCIRFATPVPALAGRRVRHPAVTVTVVEPDELVRLLDAAPQPGQAAEG